MTHSLFFFFLILCTVSILHPFHFHLMWNKISPGNGSLVQFGTPESTATVVRLLGVKHRRIPVSVLSVLTASKCVSAGSVPAGLQTLDHSLPDHLPLLHDSPSEDFTQRMKINCHCFQTSDYCKIPIQE